MQTCANHTYGNQCRLAPVSPPPPLSAVGVGGGVGGGIETHDGASDLKTTKNARPVAGRAVGAVAPIVRIF